MKRFWDKVLKGDDCWEWQGAMNWNGYGAFNMSGAYGLKVTRAHRAAWIITHNAIPVGLDVCHRCDNRKCVRPDHLFTGTRKENLMDMSIKGRASKPNAKLNKSIADSIRESFKKGDTAIYLAKKYHVHVQNIYAIVQNRTWK